MSAKLLSDLNSTWEAESSRNRFHDLTQGRLNGACHRFFRDPRPRYQPFLLRVNMTIQWLLTEILE